MAKVFQTPGSFWLHTVCLILAAALMGASFYLYGSYGRFRSLHADLDRMQTRQKMVRKQAAELNQKLKTIQRVQRFMNRASAMEMQPANWAAFDVNIQGWVSFVELQKLLEQCGASNDVYFSPIAFAVQTPEAASGADEQVQPEAGETTAKDASSDAGGDVKLVLNGAFRIRR